MNKINERKMHMLCCCETKKKEKEAINQNKSCLIWWSEYRQGSEGTVLIMYEKAKMYVIEYELMSSRLLWVHMAVPIHRLLIVACYIPVNIHNEKKTGRNF